ncbi:MAG: outer membrane beta-barrel protein [Paludibacteraceae bacterium]|nr:outer membrane beta-barrel protein [Paludibacteraceae bacterium]
MNVKRLISSLFLACCVATAFAQKISITGSVLDRETQEAIQFADVVAYLVADSSGNAADVGLTDEKGNYTLDLKKGNYNIVIDYLGYKKTTQKLLVTGETDKQVMRTIRLRPDAETLEGAVVVAKAVAVQTKGDTVEYNANTVKVAEGSTIEALIKKLPGAQVSTDGKITVNGKEIKRILVDGKEFFSDDPQVALKNLPANMIDRIKTYDKQSDETRLTGMDNDDDEAVLDLRVKKGMKHGWMGNVKGGLGGTPFHFDASAMLNRFDDDRNMSIVGQANDVNSQGFSERGGGPQRSGSAGNGLNTNVMAGLNYVRDKDNLKYGGNARYGFTDTDARKKSASEYFQQSGNTYGRDTSSEQRQRHNFGLDFQMEWKPTKLATFQFRPNINYSKTYLDTWKRSHSLNSSQKETNFSRSESGTEGNNLSGGGTARYVQQFSAKKGRNLSISGRINFDHSETDENSVSNTDFYFYNDADEAERNDSLLTLNRHTDGKRNSTTYNIQAAYTEPISTHHLLQARYSYQDREAVNESYIYNIGQETSTFDSLLSSKTDNSYSTHEMELNLQGKFTKFNYKVGFNVSPQTSESETFYGKYDGRNLKQTVWNYAPNLMMRYQFDKRHTIMLRYRGQSSAPSIENLQEVIDQTDPLNIVYGNPDLKPSYTNNLRLRYNNYFSGPQSNLAVNVSFSNTLNAVTNLVTFDNETGARSSRKVNVDGNWNGSAFLTYNTPIGQSPFSVASTTQGRLSHDVGYSSSKTSAEEKSITRNSSIGEKLNVTYSKNDYEIGAFGSVAYVNADNNLNDRADRKTYDYAVGGNANIMLPWNLNLGTDISYNFYDGYDEGLKDNMALWNAEISRSFLKNNAANIKIRYVDILQQQSNLKRTTTASAITDTRYNTLGSYFMVYFTYRFNSLGTAGTTGNDGQQRGPGGMDFGPGGPTRGGNYGGGFGGGYGNGGPRGEWGGNRPNFAADTTAGNTPREGARKRRSERVANGDSTQTERPRQPRVDENGNPIPRRQRVDENGNPIPRQPRLDENGNPIPRQRDAVKEEEKTTETNN